MIKYSDKYVYKLITITVLISLNKFYAQEIAQNQTVSEIHKITLLTNDTIDDSIDKNKLNLIIKEAETILLNAKVGTTDGLYPQEVVDNLKTIVNESKKLYQTEQLTQNQINSQIAKLESAIESLKEAEINEYLGHKESLKNEIQECLNIVSNAKEGASVGEYSKATIESFKSAIATAEKIVAQSDKNSSIYINALQVLITAKNDFQSSAINNEELEEYAKELSDNLNKISKTIKEAEVGIINGGVSENQKIALSVIYTEIKAMIKETSSIDVYKQAIQLAENALSDFNDGTISIDSNNKVNGRKLTGITSTPNEKVTNIAMTNKKEFIPKAGMLFDIKLLLNAVGVFFLSMGTIMFRQEKK